MAGRIQELTLKFSGEDAGASRVASRIGKAVEDLRGKSREPIYLNASFQRAQVAKRVEELRAEAQREAEKTAIRFHADAIEQRARGAAGVPGAIGSRDFGRSGMSGAGQRFASSVGNDVETNWYRSLKKQGEAIENATKVVRGLGALGFVTALGVKLQGVPGVVEKFQEHIKFGGTKVEAWAQAVADTVPVIGELAKGFRAVGDVIYDEVITNRGAQRRAKEERNATREVRARIEQGNERRRRPIIEAGEAGARDARRDIRLSGLEGPARERMEAQLDFEEEQRKIKDLESKRGTLNLDQQNKLREQTGQMRLAAERKLEDRLAQIQKEQGQKAFDAARGFREQAQAADDEALQARLRSKQKFLDAEIAQIRASGNKEIEEINRKRMEELKQLPEGDFRRKLIEDNAARATTAVQGRTEQQVADATREDAKKKLQEREQVERTLAERRMAGVEAEAKAGDKLAERQLKALQVAEEYRQTREDILKTLREENATEEQKTRLRGALKDLDAQEAVATALALLPDSKSVRPPTLSESRFLTGVGAGAAADVQAAEARDRRIMIDQIKKQHETMNDMLALIRPFFGGA